MIGPRLLHEIANRIMREYGHMSIPEWDKLTAEEKLFFTKLSSDVSEVIKVGWKAVAAE